MHADLEHSPRKTHHDAPCAGRPRTRPVPRAGGRPEAQASLRTVGTAIRGRLGVRAGIAALGAPRRDLRAFFGGDIAVVALRLVLCAPSLECSIEGSFHTCALRVEARRHVFGCIDAARERRMARFHRCAVGTRTARRASPATTAPAGTTATLRTVTGHAGPLTTGATLALGSLALRRRAGITRRRRRGASVAVTSAAATRTTVTVATIFAGLRQTFEECVAAGLNVSAIGCPARIVSRSTGSDVFPARLLCALGVFERS